MKQKLYTNPEAPGIYAKNPFTIDGGVASLQLTQNKTALVDLADLPLVAAHRWYTGNNHGRGFYAQAHIPLDGGKQRTLRLHRLLQETTPDHPDVDHANGDGLDNRRDNLRPASRKDNARNRRSSTGVSPYKGISWHAKCSKWRARVGIGDKNASLGLFTDPVEAALAYDAAARELHGEFAALNFPAA